MNRRSKGLELHRLDLLLAFKVLMEERSVTRASRRLFLSQSTTSGALSGLREFFQDEFALRGGGGLEPTARAIGLVEGVRAHLAGLSEAVARAARFDPAPDRRVFRLGCIDAFAFAALPRIGTKCRAA